MALKSNVKVLKRENYSYSQIETLTNEEQMEIAGNIINCASKKEMPFYKTELSKVGLFYLKERFFVCDADYAKQAVNINELLNYSNMLGKYIEKLTPITYDENNTVKSESNANKIRLAHRLKIIGDTYLKNVYAKQLDTIAFDEFVSEFVGFMHSNVSTQSKKVPIFNKVLTKVCDVSEIDMEKQEECKTFISKFYNLLKKQEQEL